MYGNYGRYVDFLQLEASHMVVKGTVILVKVGHNSVADKVSSLKLHCILKMCENAEPSFHDLGPK